MYRLLSLFFLLYLTSICTQGVRGQEVKVRNIKFAHLTSNLQAPNIDGQFDPKEWEHATLLSDFILTNGEKGTEAQQKTQCYLSYDNSFLYLGVICHSSSINDIRTHAKHHDDPLIFYDDRLEIFVDTDHNHRTYYHLVVSAKGILLDEEIEQPLPKTRTYYPDIDWNAFWTAQTSVEKDRWVAEIAISLHSIGIDSMDSGTTLGFNVGRVHLPQVKPGDDLRRIISQPPAEYSAWAEVQDAIWETVSNFYAPEDFGDLVIEDPLFRIKSISFPEASFNGALGQPSRAGQNPLRLEFDRLEKDLRMELTVTRPGQGNIFESSSEEVITWSSQQHIDKGSRLVNTSYMIFGEQEQKIKMSLVDTDKNQVLYQTSYVLIVPPFISYDLEALYSPAADDKPITMKVDGKLQDALLELRFLDEAHQVMDSTSFSALPQEGKLTPVFDTERLRRLPGGNYFIESKLINSQTRKAILSSKQPLTKFSTDPQPEKLEVVEETYSYGGIRGHAIIVKFPLAARFVFWKPASYIPWWDMDQATTSNEFLESWGEGVEGCAEPIQDRECRYSTVEIMENTEARVKVKWRYALNDTRYRIHANEWAEEYFTFYPDGTGIREAVLYATTQKEHEVFEAIYVNPPQVSTYQLFDAEIATLKNLQGESHSVRQLAENEALYHQFIQNNDQIILESHFKDRLHPYTVLALDNSLLPNVLKEKFTVGKYMAAENTRRGHWPASRYAVDGYNAVGNDLPGHFNLGNIHMMSQVGKGPNRWLFLIGAKQEQDNSDIQQAKNWLNPPDLICQNLPELKMTYDRRQKAYIIPSIPPESELSFVMESGELLHPTFLIEKNAPKIKNVKINQRFLESEHYKVGYVQDQAILYLDIRLKVHDQLTIYSDI